MKTDAATIRKWWKRWPDALIGMPTGKVTGIAVLDLDKKNSKDGSLPYPTGSSSRQSLRARRQAEHICISKPLSGCIAVTAPLFLALIRGPTAVTPSSTVVRLHLVNGADFATLPPWPDDLPFP